ncbi:unnamed protein product [Parascedosporium putredinis]|uniref:Uncharacterized protein n=1 Tax=Parascedosporium putredinis TaxID=1442378 RepID=A0A9P1HCM7_9PEZI|nr:unnamed protein product [Parascedosporium putredinis]CAI8004869.1 unnamed protein product [Parascedosporium putredinis]
MVSDGLDLSDKINLSETCKRFYGILNYDCKRLWGRLESPGKIKVLYNLAYLRPGQIACPECLVLHNIDYNDLPTRAESPVCSHFDRYRIHEDISVPYESSHARVQLALKFMRTGTHSLYLAQLLRPYTYLRSVSLMSAPHVLDVSLTLEPRIYDGHYILGICWTIHGAAEVKNYVNPRFPPFGLCPHLGTLEFKDGGFLQAARRAMDDALVAVKGCCISCRTDYVIVYNGVELIIQVWKDLGTEETLFLGPTDYNWRMFIRNSNRRSPFATIIRTTSRQCMMRLEH